MHVERSGTRCVSGRRPSGLLLATFLALLALLTLAAGGASAGSPTAGAPQRFPGPIYAASIACVDSQTCYVIGSEHRTRGPEDLFTLTDGAVAAEQTLGGAGFLSAIVCVPDGTCYAVGNESEVTMHPPPNPALLLTIANGLPGQAQPVDGAGEPRGIACAGTGACYVVGSGTDPGGSGVIVPILDGQVGQAEVVAGTWALWDIDCPTVDTCYAAGTAHSGGSAIVTVVDGQPGSVQPVGGILLQAIACPSVHTCYAAGPGQTVDGPSTSAFVTVQDGQPGPAQRIDGMDWVSAIACPSGSGCFAFGTATPPPGWPAGAPSAGAIVPITDGMAGSVISVDAGSLGGADCPSSETCYALTQDGVVPITVPGGR